jgi:hypothetical protein
MRKQKSLCPKWHTQAALICIREAPLGRHLSTGRKEETRMAALGTGYQPDEIKLMRSALDEAAIILPEAERTSAMKAKLASLSSQRRRRVNTTRIS